ncbi:aminotransferase class V-fold PLP-dependent enzyme [Metallococcus carri]|uniref:aminotransferase class V-fold PLP-dependent enzyme n=1 Tax=Metallococcus carri TaxID=1656884 RepID=UPI002E288AD1|nr:aminotransferase class V-fold PLP-dependent enzyme [Metallococcus carri]
MSVSAPNLPSTEAPTRRLSLVPEGVTPPPAAVAEGLPRTVHHELGVPTIDRRVVDFANFDHGATAPALISVTETVEKVQRTYGSVHRGAGYTSRQTTAWFEQARREIADFVGARADDQVVITRNTTDALRLLAHALPRRTQVFAWESAHHAALLPWSSARTTRLPVPHSASDALELLREALAASTARHKIVVITGACNVTGEVWPVRELVEVATEFEARTVLDAAQLAPHHRVDIADWGVDWVAFSGHKTYAPYGAGALVGRTDWLDAATPYLPAGGATRAVGARGVQWQTGPARHEGGTPNAVGAIALAAACSALTRHRERIEAHERVLHQRLREGLEAIPGVRLVHALGPERPNVGVVSFTIDGIDCSLVSQVLADEHGIAVRDGRFCAHLLCDAIVGGRGCAVRASIGLATQPHHVERLIAGVRRLVEHGPASAYDHTDAGWVAREDPRLVDEPLPW